MTMKYNKYVVYSVIVVLVALVAFNFEKITGYTSLVDEPTEITITNLKPNNVLSDRQVVRLSLKNSFPNQRIRIYNDDRFAGLDFETKRCELIGAKGSSTEYSCEASILITSRELEDGKLYYFQALDRRGRADGNKAFFTFKE